MNKTFRGMQGIFHFYSFRTGEKCPIGKKWQRALAKRTHRNKSEVGNTWRNLHSLASRKAGYRSWYFSIERCNTQTHKHAHPPTCTHVCSHTHTHTRTQTCKTQSYLQQKLFWTAILLVFQRIVSSKLCQIIYLISCFVFLTKLGEQDRYF